MPMSKTTFRAKHVIYNRNGISGRPFWTVLFEYEEEGDRMPNMVALVPTDAKLDGPDVECFVVDADRPSLNWRGDRFFPQVRAAIKAHRKTA